MNRSRSDQAGWLAVSGFFGVADAAREALVILLSLGVPRDLIEVVVDKRDAAKLFGKGPGRAYNSTTSAAGQGALSGLILSTFVSAAMISFSTSGTMKGSPGSCSWDPTWASCWADSRVSGGGR